MLLVCDVEEKKCHLGTTNDKRTRFLSTSCFSFTVLFFVWVCVSPSPPRKKKREKNRWQKFELASSYQKVRYFSFCRAGAFIHLQRVFLFSYTHTQTTQKAF